MKWIEGTFFYVRFNLNPKHYKLQNGSASEGLDDCIEQVCRKDLDLLQQYSLVTKGDHFTSTEFGDAMARYYLQFETMKVLLGLQDQAKISEIVSISQRI